LSKVFLKIKSISVRQIFVNVVGSKSEQPAPTQRLVVESVVGGVRAHHGLHSLHREGGDGLGDGEGSVVDGVVAHVVGVVGDVVGVVAHVESVVAHVEGVVAQGVVVDSVDIHGVDGPGLLNHVLDGSHVLVGAVDGHAVNARHLQVVAVAVAVAGGPGHRGGSVAEDGHEGDHVGIHVEDWEWIGWRWLR